MKGKGAKRLVSDLVTDGESKECLGPRQEKYDAAGLSGLPPSGPGKTLFLLFSDKSCKNFMVWPHLIIAESCFHIWLTSAMGTTRTAAILGHVCRLTLRGGVGAQVDAALLEAFVAQGDELAFEGLVRRHGPMVLGVCRRILRHHADADDAFQATFLVLARKGASIRPRHMVGPWLHGVAFRAARQARFQRDRHRARSAPLDDLPQPVMPAPETDPAMLAALDEELRRLPPHYSSVILLCDLEGMPQKEAARQLDCPPGTIACRLVRGRSLLARRLSRRGITFSIAAWTTLRSGLAEAALSPALLQAAIQTASPFSTGGGVAVTGATSLPALNLAQGVLKMMALKQRIAATALGAVLLLIVVGGAALLAPGMRAAENAPPPVPERTAVPTALVQADAVKSARPKIVVLTDGTEKALAKLRDTLKTIPEIKFPAMIKFSDFFRDGGLFVEPFPIEMTNLAKTDIGALARTLAPVLASEKAKGKECGPGDLFLFIKYRPDSITTKELQKALTKVKGVLPEASWAGDHNIWVRVDASGQARLAEIIRAMHDAGIQFRDPITDTEP